MKRTAIERGMPLVVIGINRRALNAMGSRTHTVPGK